MTAPVLTAEIAAGCGPFEDFDHAWRPLAGLEAFRISEGRTKDDEDWPAGNVAVQFDNANRVLDPDNVASPWYATYLNLTGASGSFASTPDAASLDITGDIDLRCKFRTSDLTPAAASVLLGKWNVGNFSYILALNPDGTILGGSTADGSTLLLASSTVSLTTVASADQDVAIKATLDVNNGAGGRTWTFYYSLDATNDHTAATWTLLGTAVTTAGTTSIFSGSASLEVGSVVGGTANRFTGRIYYAVVLSGIGGTVVADPEFWIGRGAGATSLTDPHGRVWTVNAPASIAADTATGSWLQPQVPVRILGDGDVLGMGFVQTGWEQTYEPPAMARCSIGLTDWKGVIAGNTLPDLFSLRVAGIGARSFWPLDDTIVGQARDVAGHYDGVGPNDLAHATAATTTGLTYTGVQLDGDTFVSAPVAAVPDMSAGFTILAAAKMDVGGTTTPLVTVGDGTGTATRDVAMLRIRHNGISAFCAAAGTAYFNVSSVLLDTEAAAHLLGMVVTAGSPTPSIWHDGIDVSSTTSSPAWGIESGVSIGRSKGMSDQFEGWVSDVVIIARALTNAEMADLGEAFVSALDGQTTAERQEWVLDQLGVPAAYRDLAGDVVLGPAVTLGVDAVEYLDLVGRTESGGGPYVERGVITQRHRYALWEGASAAVQATFSDDPGDATAIRVEPGSLTLQPNARTGIVNSQDVEWVGGVDTTRQPDSIAKHGTIPGPTVKTIAPTVYAARGIGDWIVARKAWPRTRLTGLAFTPSTTGEWAEALALRIGHLIAYQHTPQGIGAPIQRQAHIEGIARSWSAADGRFTVEMHLTESSGEALFLWDSSLLDGTDVLA